MNKSRCCTDIAAISSGLQLEDDGVWRSRATSNVSYPDSGNRNSFEVEDRSFWFRHRNDCIRALIAAFPPTSEGPIFDIGGGNGFVSQGISALGREVVLIEPGGDGIDNAKKRGLKCLVCAPLEEAGFKPGSFPAAGLFDVLEHIEDDASFLRTLHTLLMYDGKLYLTVPAHPLLWSREDEDAGHFRRYSVPELSRLLERTGFEVEFSTYIFRMLPLPLLMLRTLPFRLGLRSRGNKKSRMKRAHRNTESVTGRLLTSMHASEPGRIRAKRPIAFGGSCLVAARRA